VEYVDGHFFRRLPIAGNPRDERENDAMRPSVESVQRSLVASGDRLHEEDPLALWNRLGRLGEQQIAESLRRLVHAWGL
jgi:hypothetical protein